MTHRPKFIYTFYSDSGHAWLKVPMSQVLALNLQDKITACSYTDGHHVYLEEDQDAGLFLDAIKMSDLDFELKDKYQDGDSFIRRLPHYAPLALAV